MKYINNDGGRAAAGFKGSTGDCVCRAIAIASGRPYAEIYKRLADGMGTQRITKRTKKSTRGVKTARDGIYTRRKWFKEYMAELGFTWVPTMKIGSGCTVHLHDGELPAGRLVVSVSKHYTTVLDVVVHDTHDPQRDGHLMEPDNGRDLRPGEWRVPGLICSVQRRCVYGYWILN